MNDGLLIHTGINYILSPMPNITKRKGLDFQHSLLEEGVDTSGSKNEESKIIIICDDPIRLEIQVAKVGPNVGQLLILGPKNPGTVHMFSQQANAIVKAYKATWPSQNLQVLACDVSLRMLYETPGVDHAFKELWEARLSQTEDSLALLGPVLSGGLRFVIPPQENDPEASMKEIKIESFLGDSSKLFVEVNFKWDTQGRNHFDSVSKLDTVNEYVEENVCQFIDWRDSSSDDNN